MSGQINDNIKGAIIQSEYETDISDVYIELTTGPGTPVGNDMQINDLLQAVITPLGRVRVLIS